MGWYWNHLGVLGVAGGLLAWGAAAFVWSRPGLKRQKLPLVAVLIADGSTFWNVGLLYLTTSAGVAYASQAIGFYMMPLLLPAYLWLLSTLPSPLVKWLRRPVLVVFGSLWVAVLW